MTRSSQTLPPSLSLSHAIRPYHQSLVADPSNYIQCLRRADVSLFWSVKISASMCRSLLKNIVFKLVLTFPVVPSRMSCSPSLYIYMLLPLSLSFSLSLSLYTNTHKHTHTHTNIYIHIYIYMYIRELAEKFIGWPRYYHRMWPNEVLFKHRILCGRHTSFTRVAVLVPIG